jgi:carbamoyl-phosphate synthase large subunit
LKFPGVDVLLGPEMRSTGEVMGIDADFPLAFAKAQEAAGNRLPRGGRVFVSVRDQDKPAAVDLGQRLGALGFEIVATAGTAVALSGGGVPCRAVRKVLEGSPHCVDAIEAGEIALVINTTSGAQSIRDSFTLRRGAVQKGLAYFTTMQAAHAAVGALEAMDRAGFGVRSLQEYHSETSSPQASGARASREVSR